MGSKTVGNACELVGEERNCCRGVGIMRMDMGNTLLLKLIGDVGGIKQVPGSSVMMKPYQRSNAYPHKEERMAQKTLTCRFEQREQRSGERVRHIGHLRLHVFCCFVDLSSRFEQRKNAQWHSLPLQFQHFMQNKGLRETRKTLDNVGNACFTLLPCNPMLHTYTSFADLL